MSLIVNFLCWIPLLACVKSTMAVVYTNQIAVHIDGGLEEANRIAHRHGFVNLGQIGILDDHYLFEHSHIAKRSVSASGQTHRLKDESKVKWFEQQAVLSRKKRGSMQSIPTFTDPNWMDQWYLHRPNDMNMNVIPAWNKGYTGKGVVVSILDDGLEIDHPDLKDNYDAYASYDINDNDPDPSPGYDLPNTNRHGTRCAGEVAAVANNSFCGVGIAFKSSIGGVRMLDGDVTDSVEARSLSLNPQHIDIYSVGWGPDDDGKSLDGPGKLTQLAIMSGIMQGRGGKGSIFVWASGNGGREGDSCSCDGYTNSIFTLSVSSVTENGRQPWYSEQCSSTLAATYSSGGNREKQVVTTDLHHECTKQHTGTSASSPMAAGILALVLEANPKLTWRDVQYITILTARTEPFRDASWIVNGVCRKVSLKYGYGLMDASAMVDMAENWRTVPRMKTLIRSSRQGDNIMRLRRRNITLDLTVECCEREANAVRFLEHVQLTIKLSSRRRGDISLHLTSPQGTRSTLLPPRRRDRNPGNFDNWPFTSVHFWGENPTGKWTLEIEDVGFTNKQGVVVYGWSLTLYGTSIDPLPTGMRPKDTDCIKGDKAEDKPTTTLPTTEKQDVAEVKCGANEISFEVPRHLLHDGSYRLEDPACDIDVESESVSVVFGLDECGTKTHFTESHVIYRNYLTNFKSGSSVLIECKYPRSENTSRSFQTGRNVILTASNYGHLPVSTVQYTSSQFLQTVNSSRKKGRIVHDSTVYIGLSVGPDVTDRLQVSAITCVTSASDTDDVLLIDHSCAQNPDVEIYEPNNGEYRFSFVPSVSEGHVHCKVMICDPTNDGSTGCSLGCRSSDSERNKRDIEENLITTGGHFKR